MDYKRKQSLGFGLKALLFGKLKSNGGARSLEITVKHFGLVTIQHIVLRGRNPVVVINGLVWDTFYLSLALKGFVTPG